MVAAVFCLVGAAFSLGAGAGVGCGAGRGACVISTSWGSLNTPVARSHLRTAIVVGGPWYGAGSATSASLRSSEPGMKNGTRGRMDSERAFVAAVVDDMLTLSKTPGAADGRQVSVKRRRKEA